MNYKFFNWLFASLIVFSSIICTTNVYANKDKVSFDDAYGLWPAAQNPGGFNAKVTLPDGFVMTKVDGSLSSADFKDKAEGTIDLLNADAGDFLVAQLPVINICLSVQGNTAYLWHKFTATVPGFCNKDDLGLLVITVNPEDGSGTIIPLELGAITIPGCDQNNEDYIPPGAPSLPLYGVKVKDGV